MVDLEVQRAGDAGAHESQESAAKETEASETVAADNEPEDKTSSDPETGSSNGTIATEHRALLSDTRHGTVWYCIALLVLAIMANFI